MADRKNEDVANALAALAGGQVPSETDMASSGIPSESTVFSPTPPPKPVEKSAEKPAAPPAKPAAAAEFRRPKTAAPADAPKRLAAPAPARPTKPQAAPPATVAPVPAAVRTRPTNPTPAAPPDAQASEETPRPARIRPAAPQRPVAPPPPPPEPEPVISETLPEIVEDDQMDAPAPDVSTLARTPVHKKKPPHAPLYANLNFRRTIIPILLTTGVMLPLLGLWTLLDSNSALHAAGMPFAILLLVVGAVLLIFAVLNILHVKHLLEKEAKPT